MTDKKNFINVFDNEIEFEKLYNKIMSSIDEYAEERSGNLTYGEIMFVLEALLDKLYKENNKDSDFKIYTPIELSSVIYNLTSMLKEKNIISGEELNKILQ